MVRELVDEAAQWLRGKNTDQWAAPWPDLRGRDKRIEDDVHAGRTWIAWDADMAAATITIDTKDPVDPAMNPVWPARHLTEDALYVHRVVVRRSHAGRELGARLLDWASSVALRKIGYPLLRIDVWTDNEALHGYYRDQGFILCGFREAEELVPGYPARALFERRVSPNGWREHAPLFHEQQLG